MWVDVLQRVDHPTTRYAALVASLGAQTVHRQEVLRFWCARRCKNNLVLSCTRSQKRPMADGRHLVAVALKFLRRLQHEYLSSLLIRLRVTPVDGAKDSGQPVERKCSVVNRPSEIRGIQRVTQAVQDGGKELCLLGLRQGQRHESKSVHVGERNFVLHPGAR